MTCISQIIRHNVRFPLRGVNTPPLALGRPQGKQRNNTSQNENQIQEQSSGPEKAATLVEMLRRSVERIAHEKEDAAQKAREAREKAEQAVIRVREKVKEATSNKARIAANEPRSNISPFVEENEPRGIRGEWKWETLRAEEIALRNGLTYLTNTSKGNRRYGDTSMENKRTYE